MQGFVEWPILLAAFESRDHLGGMLRTSDLDSTIFRHLTGKAKPALIHPTNTAFDPAGWKAVVDAIGDEPLSPRDMLLMQVAMLIGVQNAILRHRYTSKLFAGFAPDQVLTLALANANRGYLVIKFKADVAAAAAFEAAGGRPLDFGAISQLLIEPAPGQSPATADDLNNSFVDTLPHWFALARDITEGSRAPGEDLGGIAQRAGACLSLEHAFRSIWQEALWEPWRFGQGADGYVMVPDDTDWMAGWRVWDLREQSLHLQGAMLNRQLEKRIPNAYLTRSLARTVTAIDLDAVPPTLTVAAPSEQQAAAHRMSIDAVSDAYTFVFADQVVGAPGVTVALLSEAVLVLQDLAVAALPEEYDPVAPDWTIMERLACKLPRATLIEALRDTLGIGLALAEACIAFLTVDPAADLGELFRIGLWHKPLVAMADGEHVLIAAGALIWGSPIRRTERWLQATGGDDLSKTPNGLIYEAQVRTLAEQALRENTLFASTDWCVSHLPKGKAKEEVDLLVRIGNRVLVGEIKCFLGPSEPSECYNYVRKLEKAADQARRKSDWLATQPALLDALLGGSGALEIVPLVIVNQSNGVGLVLDGCQVTDAHFLQIVLGDGDYHRGAKFENDEPIEFNVETLYATVKEAEERLTRIFAEHLGVQRYRDAVRWTTNVIPLGDGSGSLQIAYPIVDETAYYAAGPFAGTTG
ncbi:hypothetical protein KY084_10885 [Stakelama sp. CBK3Z-3]|uniref:NERD domain-containing protein n=1 Tax=Stakelama flava TaxID=2860338 RepID=A0ABS6XMG5_9SPHN|nr:hypothetical protein [Stakelama flava]MBW4331376.1 hypothetical protein [Stakelama flava]